MTNFSDYSLKFTGLKCFDSKPQGFETIKPVNLIIGRNNSGKSTLLDLFPSLVEEKYSPPSFLSRNVGTDVNAYLSVSLTAEMIEKGFYSKDSGGHYGHFDNLGQFSSRLVDKIATVRYSNNRFEFVSLEDEPEITHRLIGNWGADFHHRVTRCLRNPFENHKFHRIHPERSLKPEPDQSTDVFGDGTGGTNQIQQFLNLDHLPRELVREKLLDQLNRIVNPDSEFTEITTMRINQSDRWEVFLKEPGKGLIPLSRSGHGLQTIILVLIHTILLTYKDDDLSSHIFGFEELENNLHPALFRRLLSHIRNLATESGGTFLLTTHSHVAIDLFRRDKDAQMRWPRLDGRPFP